MKKILFNGKIILFFLVAMLILIFTNSIIYYFFKVSYKTINVILLIGTLLTFLIGGFLQGSRASTKGYLAGFKIGLILVLIFIALNFIFIKNFNLANILYYGILILSSVLGGMIGINKKKK